MPKRRAKFTFPMGLITQPVIYDLGQNFRLVTNIRRADVREDVGLGHTGVGGRRGGD